MKLTNNTVLITGGTSGIGLELARKLKELGNTVIVTGRSTKKITQVNESNPGLITHVVDVSNESSVKELAIWAKENYADLNIVINSAGIMRSYNLLDEELSVTDMIAEISTNLIGTITVDKIFLPQLLSKSEVLIVNISSGLANLSAASHPVYSATKAGVHMFTSTLREQLDYAQVNNIHVMELVPPLVAETNLESIVSTDMPNNMSLKDLVAVAISGMENNKIRVDAGFAAQMRQAGQTSPDETEHQMGQQMLKKYFPKGLL